MPAPSQEPGGGAPLYTLRMYSGAQATVTLDAPPDKKQQTLTTLTQIDKRLQTVEGKVTAIETDMKHVATKLWVTVTFGIAAIGVITTYIGALWAFSKIFLPPMLREIVGSAVQEALHH